MATTLFAAFEVATGKVRAAHKKRRRRKEFLDFMDDVVAAYPTARLKVILDNLNTHQKNDEWLKRHPLVTFHFTPTRASWLNQVEGWFSILQGQSLTGPSFTSDPNNSSSMLMHSSKPTTKMRSRSSGQDPKSTSAASRDAVLVTCDSGY